MWSINASVARAVISFTILFHKYWNCGHREVLSRVTIPNPALVTLHAPLGDKETRKLLATPDPTIFLRIGRTDARKGFARGASRP